MNKSTGRAFTSGHQSAARKVDHAPAANRVDTLCGKTNTVSVLRSSDGNHMMASGSAPRIWKGDKPELMVTCKACRREMGL
jgi:hypothetical protein